MEYRTAIVDELGEPVMMASDYTDKEISVILENHAEWRLKCIPFYDSPMFSTDSHTGITYYHGF